MNLKFFVALIVYIVTIVVIEIAMGGLKTSVQSTRILFIAHTTALASSWLVYYFIRRHDQRPSVPTGLQSWLKLIARVVSSLLAVGVIAFIMPQLLEAIYGNFRIWLFLRLSLFTTFIIVTNVLIPVTFWVIMSLGSKGPNRGTKSSGIFVPIWMAANLVWIVAVIYAAFVDFTDTSGWSALLTMPIYRTFALPQIKNSRWVAPLVGHESF